MRAGPKRLFWAYVRNLAARLIGGLGPLDKLEVYRLRRAFAEALERGDRYMIIPGPFRQVEGGLTGDLTVTLPVVGHMSPEERFWAIHHAATYAWACGGHLTHI